MTTLTQIQPVKPSWRAWWISARPAAFPKLLFPVGLGLHLAGWPLQAQHAGGLLALGAFLLPAHLAIVLCNDLADRRADGLEVHGNPAAAARRPLAAGRLGHRSVLVVAVLSLLACLLLALWQEGGIGPLSVLVLAAEVCVLAYGFAPFAFNYRGGGEVLEALGTGVLLPLIVAGHFHGVLLDHTAWLLCCGFLLGASSALGSGLSHIDADRRSGKKTLAVLWSPVEAARLSLLLLLVAAGALLWHSWPGMPPLAALPALALFLPATAALRTQAFARYKKWQKGILLLLWLALWSA